MKKIIYGLLILSIIVLTYLCVNTILTPIRFAEQREQREKLVIQRLVDIRNAQVEFKKQHVRYTASFDSLIQFVNNGKMAIVLKEGILTDEQLEQGLTEKEAVKQGLIKRDTSYVSVKEALFGADYPVDSICYVPFGNGVKFELAANVLKTSSDLNIYVFECKTPYTVYLEGLDEQEIINIIDIAEKLERYPGLKVGSVEESNNNAGNWE
jgi:hypothetical protein